MTENGKTPESTAIALLAAQPGVDLQTDEDDGADIGHYLWIVRRRLWLVIVLPLLAFALTFFFTMGKPPLYKATTRLLIGEQSSDGAIGDKSVDAVGWGKDERYLETQYTLLQDPSLALTVIDHLGLVENPEFTTKPKRTAAAWLDRAQTWLASLIPTSRTPPATSPAPPGDEAAPKPEAAPPAKPAKRLVGPLLRRLEVKPVKKTRLVDVSCTAHDPQTATEIVNALAQLYIDQEIERDLTAMERVLGYLREQQTAFQSKVQESEKALLQYKRETNLIALESREEIQKDKLAAFTIALADTRVARIGAESRLKALKGDSVDVELLKSIGKFTSAPEVAAAAREYMRLREQERRLGELYGPKHEKMFEAKADVKEAKALLEGEITLAVDAAEADLAAAVEREERLTKALAEQKQEALGLEDRIILYNVFKREAETNRQLFDVLLRKAEETSLAGDIQKRKITIICPADVPDHPVPSKRKRYLILSVVLGLAAAIGLAFLLEQLDQSVKGVHDLEDYVGVSYLGSLGHMRQTTDGVPYLVVREMEKSSYAEGFRTIRTNLMFSAGSDNRRSLTVTSSVPKEGKSTISSNLAVAIAQSGKRVLLVDGDMRRPSIAKAFDIQTDVGLSSFLVGEATEDQVVYESSVDNLSVVPCGRVPKNQSELLGSDTMAQFIKWAEDNYDVTIYDTPPVSSVSDPLVLSAMTRTAVMVIRAGDTSRAIAKRCTQQLRDLDVRVLGAVVNDIDQKHSSYYHYYGYAYYRRYYRYGYGRGYGDGYYHDGEEEKEEAPEQQRTED